MFYASIIISLNGLLKFIYNKTYFLISLLRLELLGVRIFIKLIIENTIIDIDLIFFIFIVFLVSESCLGLSILIFLTSLNRNNYINRLNVTIC